MVKRDKVYWGMMEMYDRRQREQRRKKVVLEKDLRGSKVLERCDIVSTSEIKAGKEHLDHEVKGNLLYTSIQIILGQRNYTFVQRQCV